MDPQSTSSSSSADPRQQVIEKIKSSTNVLLTVSANPSVDQLAAAIGMTLLLNKLGKHATAVFSGEVPSTIEFLQPDKTFEKTTDSLRDFIISLDKSKADKLRYKIEDKFVKIFITPYHTSLTDKDLEFSEGDYNVDVILALGVKKRDDLDQTIVTHGRILHDATVISINNTQGADLGSINWVKEDASGLSEMLVGLNEDLKTDQEKLIDEQIATCFLTGIVAETERFSNAKTSPQTMSLAAKLMNAGANQQLIATKLEPVEEAPEKPTPEESEKKDEPIKLPALVVPSEPASSPEPTVQPPAGPPEHVQNQAEKDRAKQAEAALNPKQEKKEVQDGSLMVPHDGITGDNVSYNNEPQENIAKIHIDDHGTLKRIAEEEAKQASDEKDQTDNVSGENRKIVDEPPALGGALSANTKPQPHESSSDPMSLPDVKGPTLNHVESVPMPSEQADEDKSKETLSDLEQDVNSPHLREVDGKPGPENLLPENLVGPDKGLAPDQTSGSDNPSPPPPVPPPLTMPPPPNLAPGNMSDPNSGVPM